MKKLFSLLTLLLLLCTSAWGEETEIFSFSIKSGAANLSVNHGSSVELNTTDHLYSISGGTVTLKNKRSGSGSQAMISTDNNETHITFSHSDLCVVVNLGSTTLQKGDVITINSNGSNKICLTASETRNTSIATSTGSGEKTYTIPVNSDLIDKTKLYLWRNSGNTYIKSMSITRSDEPATYTGLTPTSTLDLSEALSTTFTTTWYTSNNMQKNCYYDAYNGVAYFSTYALFNNDDQTWVENDEINTTSSTWATANFKGNAYYFSTSSKAVTMRNTDRMYYFRVKNCTGASALVNNKAIIEAYEVKTGVVDADPATTNSINGSGALSLTSLSASKEYIIKVYGNNGGSSVSFQEITFNFPAVTSVSVTKLADRTYGTFVAPQNLDFTGVDGMEAYVVASEPEGSEVTISKETKIPTGTAFIVKTTSKATTSVSVPTTGGPIELENDNLLIPGDGTTAFNSPANTYYYYINADKFHLANSGTLQSGKAYLKITSTGAPSLIRIVDEENTATNIKSVDAVEEGIKFIQNGQLFIKKNGVVYDMLGHKVQ